MASLVKPSPNREFKGKAMINLRDKGAELWDKANRPQRVTFVVVLIALIALLPFAGSFSITSFLNTPISSYEAVLVYAVGMFVRSEEHTSELQSH